MVAAYALTPFAAFAFAYVAEMTLWGHAGSYARGNVVTTAGSAPSEVALSLAMGAGLIAVFVTVFGLLPLVAWLVGRGPLSLRMVLLLGGRRGIATIALLCLLIFVSHLARGTMPDNPGDLWYGSRAAFRTATEGLFVGMGCAAVFWVVAIRGTEVDEGRQRRQSASRTP